MIVLPLVLSLGLGAAICPRLVSGLGRRGFTRINRRGATVPFPTGVAIVAVAALSVGALALWEAVARIEALPAGIAGASIFVVGVAALGFVDDVLGARDARAPKGVRAHARTLASGRPSTGALKAGGTAVLALAVLAPTRLEPLELVVAASVMTLAAHVFNLLDLRPGRSIKALIALGAALSLATLDLAAIGLLGVFLGPILALLALDLRERGMLGDTGAGAVGAVAGVWIVTALPLVGQLAALGALAVVTVYGELRSITALIGRSPILGRIDSLGRTHA